MPEKIHSISVQDLKSMMDSKQDFQLIDVREQDEYDFCNIGGELIPVGQILKNIDTISKEKPVVMLCHSGFRSRQVVAALQSQFGFNNLINLQGGIDAWSEMIDPNVPQY